VETCFSGEFLLSNRCCIVAHFEVVV
jgi:hypothetical protein